MYDYSALRRRITVSCGTQVEFAKKMGLSERSVTLKLNNKRFFRQPEISKAVQVLGLSESDIPVYFFRVKE
ncbi:MAG: DUF739 family protein [Clostridia bacterium]|nr:DUF739 family protein [Clostridia bacterium]